MYQNFRYQIFSKVQNGSSTKFFGTVRQSYSIKNCETTTPLYAKKFSIPDIFWNTEGLLDGMFRYDEINDRKESEKKPWNSHSPNEQPPKRHLMISQRNSVWSSQRMTRKTQPRYKRMQAKKRSCNGDSLGVPETPECYRKTGLPRQRRTIQIKKLL